MIGPTRTAIACSGLALVSAVALLACGEGSEPGAGQLNVTQVFTPAEPIAIEGSAAKLAVKQDGRLIERVRTGVSQVDEP